MNKYLHFEAITIGLAMFSMFFGAGNIIFPLALGQFAGDKNSFAIIGLIFTAVLIPFAGVFGMILFDGNLKQFFGRLGKGPGLLVALFIITLLGPLGSTPRCIALTFTTLKAFLPSLSPVYFSAASCLVIYFFTVRKNHILSLLGKVLTPLLLISLAAIVFIGLLTPSGVTHNDQTQMNLFFHGLKEGYNTMDLLAGFFFSSTIISLLKDQAKEHKKNYIHLALQASCIGAFLLSIVYIGFSSLAAFHGSDLQNIPKDELLSAITLKIAGPSGGILVALTISLACLTTAIALIAIFSDFMQKEIFHEKLSYNTILIASLILTFAISTLEFKGISAFLGPILEICYPGLIVLTFTNIAHQLIGFRTFRVPVFATFAGTALSKYFYF